MGVEDGRVAEAAVPSDGLEDLRAEVLADPVARRAAIIASVRTLFLSSVLRSPDDGANSLRKRALKDNVSFRMVLGEHNGSVKLPNRR